MGSLLSPSPLSRSPAHIYVAFCSKHPDHNQNFANWISRFDPSDNTWSYVTSIPGISKNQVLKDFAMTYVGGSIYVIGGRLCVKEINAENGTCSSNGISEREVEVLPTVLRYNINSGQWSNCAPLSLQRYNFACTVCDDKIYVAGGLYETGNARSTSLAEIYDPLLNRWSDLPNMKRLRYNCAGVTWQNKVHVVGGFIEGCDPNQAIANYVERCSAEVYDADRGKWDLIPGMWQLDVPPNQIVAVDDRLFSCGDCLNVCKGHLEVYDGKLNLWNVVEGPERESPCITQRMYVTMAPIGRYLYFLTGCKIVGDEACNVSVVCRFDTTARENAWTRFDPVQEEEEKELCSHCCVATSS